jgi:hypothetical protein
VLVARVGALVAAGLLCLVATGGASASVSVPACPDDPATYGGSDEAVAETGLWVLGGLLFLICLPLVAVSLRIPS